MEVWFCSLSAEAVDYCWEELVVILFWNGLQFSFLVFGVWLVEEIIFWVEGSEFLCCENDLSIDGSPAVRITNCENLIPAVFVL